MAAPIMLTLQATSGFGKALQTIQKIPDDILAETTQEVLEFLENKRGSVNTTQLHERSEASGCRCTREDIQSVVHCLTDIYRFAAENKLDSENLANQLHSDSAWKEKSIQIIAHAWKHHEPAISVYSQVKDFTSIGQLVDIQWKFGVAMSSSICKNLNSPYITMLVKIANPTGHLVTKSFEMSIPEFQNLSHQLKEIAGVLETV